MKLHIERKKDTEAVLQITADSEELAKVKNKVLRVLAPRVKVAGFRDGKVPTEVVEKNIDQQMLQTEFINEAINTLFIASIKEDKIRPVGQPQVNVTKFVPFTELEFTMTVPVVGEIKLPNYKKFSAKKEEVKIGADQVKEVLKSLQGRAAQKNSVERAAKLGDEAVIDFKGTSEKGEAISGADGTDYPLVLGSGTFIPGFEDEIVGLKPGDEKSFNITFPKDYGAKALQNAKVTFAITLKTVNELSEPKLDDSFASTVGPFETLQQLKDDIKKQLEHEAKHKAERDWEAAIVNELADKTKVEIPETLVEEQKQMVVQEVRQNVVQRGMTFEEMLASIGKTEEEYLESEVTPEAVRRVKAGLMLSEIADNEGIVVEPDALEARIQALKGQYRDSQMQEELDKPENRREINARMRTEKVIEFLKTQG
ncbi:trigger factor [Candidatus Saccharibacteria bacterium]|nr:trigger factor [Candidatus Saccharibacteria bacterium]MCA9328292.1 trigger factor [Candidatus Saccharibacteria bacterium]